MNRSSWAATACAALSLLASLGFPASAIAAEDPIEECKRTEHTIIDKDEGPIIVITITCKGEKGDRGPKGPAGPVRAPVIETARVTLPNGIGTPVIRGPVCPDGTKVISGGVSVDHTNGITQLSGYPNRSRNQWVGSMRNTGPSPVDARAYSVCLPVG